MGINFLKEPKLERPIMIAAWPGIGNIGLIAADTIRTALEAEQFAEIDAWDFFYPSSVTIRNGELASLEFPTSRFYFKKTGDKDLIFFIGEQQPSPEKKGYELASLVLDLAARYGCERLYTCGAAVSPIHHTRKSRVWAVPNKKELLEEVKAYPNTILLGEVESRKGQGSVTGLNGLLLGLARARGLDGICLLGEIPVYISQFPTSYPGASRSVLEVLSSHLHITLDLSGLDKLAREVEATIESIYEQMPPEIKQRIDHLKSVEPSREEEKGPITEEEKKRIVRDLEEFFQKGGKD